MYPTRCNVTQFIYIWKLLYMFRVNMHGPHPSTSVVISVVRLSFVLFYVLFVCKCVLPPGDNPIAVNKYIISYFKTPALLVNPLNPELNPICYLLAHHFLHVSRIRVKSLTIRLLMSYIYGAPILDVSRSHTTTQQSR